MHIWRSRNILPLIQRSQFIRRSHRRGSDGSNVRTRGDGNNKIYDGTLWTSESIGAGNALGGLSVEGLWGSASTDIWAGGFGGQIQHFDGADWSVDTSPTTDDIHGANGTPDGTVFFVGENGVIVIRSPT